MKTLLKFLALAAVVMHIVALAYNADARPRRTGTISTVDGASYGPYFEDFNVVGCVSCHGSPVIHLVGEDHVASGNWVSRDNPGASTTFTNNGAVPHSSISGSYPQGFGPAHGSISGLTGAVRLDLGTGNDVLDLPIDATHGWMGCVIYDSPTNTTEGIMIDGNQVNRGWRFQVNGGADAIFVLDGFSGGSVAVTDSSAASVGRTNTSCFGWDFAASTVRIGTNGNGATVNAAVADVYTPGTVQIASIQDYVAGGGTKKVREIYFTTTPATQANIIAANKAALSCATPGQCYVEDANAVAHCGADLYSSGKLNCWKLNGADLFTTVGAPTIGSSRYNWPYQVTKIDREGAGPFTDANYLSLGTGSDVMDFTPAGWTVCADFTPIDLSNSPVLISNIGPAVDGYYMQLLTTGALRCVNGNGNVAADTANAGVINGINTGCCGYDGTKLWSKLNAGTGASSVATYVVPSTRIANIGRYVNAGNSFNGIVHEVWASTAPFNDAIMLNVQRRFFGMMTNLGYTPVSVTNTTVRSQVSDGRLTYAPPNTLRHGWGTSDYSNVGVGSIYEGQTINTDIFSEQLNNGAAGQWIATNTTVTADQGVFADGATSMELVNTTVVGGRIMYAATTASSATFTASGWFRSDAGSKVGTTGVFCGGVLTVTACTCYRDDGGTCTADGTLDVNQSCIAYGTFDTTKPVRMAAIATCSAATTTPSHFFAGGRYATTAAQLYIGGAQLEVGTSLSTYCGPTLAVTKTCNADVVTMSNPLRPPGNDWTNAVVNSEALDSWTLLFDAAPRTPTVTANAALANDGSMSAEKVTFPQTAGATQYTLLRKNFTGTAVPWSAGIWMRGSAGGETISVNIQSLDGLTNNISTCTLTTGWTLCKVENKMLTAAVWTFNVGVDTIAGEAPQAAQTVFLWGAQAHIGALLLNYCGPTLAASLTCGPGGAIGKTRTNVIPYNQQLNQIAGGWARVNLNTVTPNAIAGPTSIPVGAGDLVIEDGTAAAIHVLSASYTATAAPWTASIYAKAKERNWFAFSVDSGVTNSYFNATTCTVGTINGAATAAADVVDNGWCRVRVTSTPAAGARTVNVYLASADNTAVYNGDNASGMYFTGVQVELGSEATPPCGETFGSARRCSPKQQWCARIKNAVGLNGRAWSCAGACTQLSSGTVGSANSFYVHDAFFGIYDGYGVQVSNAPTYVGSGPFTTIICSNDGVVTSYVNTTASTAQIGTGYGLFTAWPSVANLGGRSAAGNESKSTIEAIDWCNAGTPAECGW